MIGVNEARWEVKGMPYLSTIIRYFLLGTNTSSCCWELTAEKSLGNFIGVFRISADSETKKAYSSRMRMVISSRWEEITGEKYVRMVASSNYVGREER